MHKMSTEDFEKLISIVLQNKVLQKELQEISEMQKFIFRVAEIGSECGLDFDEETVLQKLRENRRLWIERWI